MRLVLGLLAWLLAMPASAVTIDWVEIGGPGNAPSRENCVVCGSVPYVYFVSKYEVTNAQYMEFLNTKAASDPLGLYNTDMGTQPWGGITRTGVSGGYSYSVKPGFANKPVLYVSYYDAVRFVNWLGNGQGTGDTETGAYTVLGGTPTPSNEIMRNAGANIFLPNQNEWYKAAYYDVSSARYFDYPAGTNVVTTCSAPTAAPNHANCGDAVGTVTDVGAYTGSPSPNGTLDQGGNVFEWIDSPSLSVFGERLIRGGSFADPAFDFLFENGSVPAIESFIESGIIGIRIASLVPEPETSLLVMTGLAGLAARRRAATA